MTDEQFNPEKTLNDLKQCLSRLDTQVTSGEGARGLHDFLQDDLGPLLVEVQKNVLALAYYMGRHEDRLDSLEDPGSQLEADDGAALLEHLETVNAMLAQVNKTGKLPGVAERIKKGEEMIELVRSITMEDEDEEPEPEAEPPAYTGPRAVS
jgi:hypothetical protein